MSAIRPIRSFKPTSGSFPDYSSLRGDGAGYLQKPVRYPEDLFLIQAQLYRAYHMDTPEVFYNREDHWQFPRRQAGIDDGGDAEMSPTT